MRLFSLSLLILCGVILTVIADVFLKRSVDHGINTVFLLLGLVLYASVAFPVALAFRMIEFGELFLVWEAVTVGMGVFIATVVFKEPLTVHRLVAFVLVIAALILSNFH